MVVVARVTWRKEPERWEDADLADVDAYGRLRIWASDGRLLAEMEAGDWIDAQADDGPVVIPPQAY